MPKSYPLPAVPPHLTRVEEAPPWDPSGGEGHSPSVTRTIFFYHHDDRECKLRPSSRAVAPPLTSPSGKRSTFFEKLFREEANPKPVHSITTIIGRANRSGPTQFTQSL